MVVHQQSRESACAGVSDPDRVELGATPAAQRADEDGTNRGFGGGGPPPARSATSWSRDGSCLRCGGMSTTEVLTEGATLGVKRGAPAVVAGVAHGSSLSGGEQDRRRATAPPVKPSWSERSGAASRVSNRHRRSSRDRSPSSR